jgi:4-hydroxy-tetrahydrodipicolinate reductase
MTSADRPSTPRPINVCVAGATGWTGSLVAKAVLAAPDLRLVGAIARKSAGQDAGETLGASATGVRITATLDQAAAAAKAAGQPIDVLVDYTKPDSVKERTLAALALGIRVVVGTSGLAAADFDTIDARARAQGLGVIAAGNFSITAALAKHFALIAARHLPSWEIIDYAHAEKPDAPSGTTRELAEALAGVRANRIDHPVAATLGHPEARGAAIAGTQVHSVRVPGLVIAFETLFGLPHERLTIRHDAGSGADPYVNGTLLAVRKVMAAHGLTRGLDTLLFGAAQSG